MYIPESGYKSKTEYSHNEGGKSYTKCVYEVENGFIAVIEERDAPEEGKPVKDYVEPIVTIYISKTNPFDVKKEKEKNTLNLEKLFDY